jgi:hypothetical protein
MKIFTSSSTLLGDWCTACFSINAGFALACEYAIMRLLNHTTTGSNSLRIIVSNIVVDPSKVGIRLFGRVGRL